MYTTTDPKTLVFTVRYLVPLQQFLIRVSRYNFLTFVINVIPREVCSHVWVCDDSHSLLLMMLALHALPNVSVALGFADALWAWALSYCHQLPACADLTVINVSLAFFPIDPSRRRQVHVDCLRRFVWSDVP